LPRQADNSDHPDTLPTPELNPLLNPLLGQNMGRWAEVYFTSPPEKREQAVLELLHELQTDSQKKEVTDDSVSNAVLSKMEPVSIQEQFPPPPIAEVQPGLDHCRACGFENPPDQRFCGMCGARLNEESAVGDAPLVDSRPVNSLMEDSVPAESRQVLKIEPVEQVVDEFPWRDKFSLFQTEREARSGRYVSLFQESELGTTPYRRYLGMGLAILILAIGYFVWRNTVWDNAQHTSESSQAVPPAASTTTEQPATPTLMANSAQSDAPAQNNPPNAENIVASSRAAEPVHDAYERTEAKEAVPQLQSSAGNLQTPTISGNGAEELAMAQSYLNGTDGRQRNSTEAVGWLWKAVAKHNGDATLLLSDLYMKGDGVSKNCDQARVLLDAAARKGMKDAGERLRHLQAFGCE
jgi:hypothetical protein